VTPTRVFSDEVSELWHADALVAEHVAAVMGSRIADAIIVDAPYSEKTHSGHSNGKLTADRAAAWAKSADGQASKRANFKHEVSYAARKSAAGESGRRDIDYAAWSPDDVGNFCAFWLPRSDGWCVSITDDQLAPAWSASFSAADLYPFAPLPLVETGSRVRMTGDGPSNWTCWVVVARPRSRRFASWGTLPGAYVQPAERDFNSAAGTERIVGGKPVQSMCRIVSDYTRRGALVVDPCCGAATTGLGAKMQGRRFIGMDVDAATLEIAARRLADAREQGSLNFAGVANG
jgi:hypothetical protein